MVPDPPMMEMSGLPIVMLDNTSFVPLNFSTASDMISYNVTNSTVNVTKVTNISISYMRRDPLIVVIPMTILYSVIFISGLLGNVITCIVIAKNRAMHTATNYYLFSLAISDLLLLTSGMPFEIYEIWFRFQPYPFGEGICILQGFAAETSANATVLTITAFTAERYIAICHPFLSHTMSKLSRAIKFILGIWLLAMGLAIPQILDLGIIEKYETCGPKNDERKYVFTISSIVCFVFPMVIITVFYILIGLQLRKSKIVGRSATANGNSIRLKTKYRVPSKRPILITLDKDEKTNPLLMPPQTHSLMEVVYSENKQDPAQRTTTRCHEEGRKNYSQNRYTGSRHVINMLVAVVVAFFVCWAPHHAQRIFAMNADEKHADIYDIITPISGVLYYVSTCINPLLYNIMSYKFREAFKDTCARCVYQRGRGQFPANGRLSRNVSQRSNSHSIHTCSSICSGQLMQQVNACILEQDLSLLKCSKRPLTVTFRKLGRHQHTNPQVGISSEVYPSDVSRKSSPKAYTQQPLSYRKDFNAYNGHVGALLCKNTTPEWKDQKENIGCNLVLSREKQISTSKINERLPTMKSRNSFECNYSSISKKDVPPSSPYETPEMTASTKKLEKNLQNILKDLTMNDELNKSHATDTPPGGIVKSQSISNFIPNK